MESFQHILGKTYSTSRKYRDRVKNDTTLHTKLSSKPTFNLAEIERAVNLVEKPRRPHIFDHNGLYVISSYTDSMRTNTEAKPEMITRKQQCYEEFTSNSTVCFAKNIDDELTQCNSTRAEFDKILANYHLKLRTHVDNRMTINLMFPIKYNFGIKDNFGTCIYLNTQKASLHTGLLLCNYFSVHPLSLAARNIKLYDGKNCNRELLYAIENYVTNYNQQFLIKNVLKLCNNRYDTSLTLDDIECDPIKFTNWESPFDADLYYNITSSFSMFRHLALSCDQWLTELTPCVRRYALSLVNGAEF